MRDDRDRLGDILIAVDRILQKAPSERASFSRMRCFRCGFSIICKS
jgi:CRISPR/Cas system-associated exonuclease Cas4 (RecB family)